MWESLDSAGLTSVNSSSVRLSDGGGVLRFSSVSNGEEGKLMGLFIFKVEG